MSRTGQRFINHLSITMATRWAICGAGKISWDFCSAIKTLPEGEHQIVAVAARDGKKAADFASHFNIPNSFDNYAALAELKDVDVIYIGLIHTGHVEWSLKYIERGKNVVCEKPMALSVEGAKKVLQAAKEKGVFFLEGYWTRFFPAYKFLLEQVASGAIGDIKIVEVSFCLKFGEVERILKKDLGGGALMDIGCYPVQIANIFLKGKPEAIQSMLSVTEDEKVDKGGVIQLRYSDGRFASLCYSGETEIVHNSLVLRGTKGSMKIPDHCWNPDQVILPNGETKDFPLPPVEGKDPFNFANSIGFVYEIQCVRECLQKGLLECPSMKHEDSLIVMEILCEVLKTHDIAFNML